MSWEITSSAYLVEIVAKGEVDTNIAFEDSQAKWAKSEYSVVIVETGCHRLVTYQTHSYVLHRGHDRRWIAIPSKTINLFIQCSKPMTPVGVGRS